MRKLIFAINVTLDGFADHEAGIADDELHQFFADLLRSGDAILFGRVTYQLLESYWPFAPDLPTSTQSEIDFANQINSMPKIVFSRTLEKVTWNNSRLVKEDVVEEVIKLKEQPGKDLLVGSLSLASIFTEKSLIDEYWLVIHPIVLGRGKPLFKGLRDRVNLKLIDTRTFKSGVVVFHYQAIS